MKKAKNKKKPHLKKLSRNTAKDPIVIDQDKGLVFQSEKELYDFFLSEITQLEQEFYSLRSEDDIANKEFKKYEANLEQVIENPDEVWIDSETLKGRDLAIYIRLFNKEKNLYHVAMVYLTGDTPSFIYLHFPTTMEDVVDNYRRGEKVYDRSAHKNIQMGAVEGDALGEGDEMAVGLYQAMLKLRNPKDIAEDTFQDYVELRESTIQEPDEIWRSTDSQGNTLVSFVKEFDELEEPDIHYVVVTLEDEATSSHSLLFSFPTTDANLIDRYRHGENLQAEEVVQESSH